ncbi:50S ribosomal protein L17 [Emticicia sp. BO119]|uniref:50S ribosomal protein L17 n=1 Tax=Emticicia sp. BO119 TaxID=2757768 RepID=UPI0015F03CD7|nr:50S ribosomal protein L17 [Emticicia sp. BO119]MBA4851483.1 50S ribosomal protein L17 [Emticicia sp. BO119]
MRHGNKTNHLGRTHSHRDALLKNLAISLIQYKRIETTLAKAKELRKFVEPLITKSKNDTTHSRRTVFSYLQDKESIKTLFGEIAEKVASRNGGYTRIIKLGTRFGDNAEVALIELVDYNEAFSTAVEEKTTKTRRSRRGGKKSEGNADVTPVAVADESSAEVVEDEAPVAAVEAEPATEVADATPAAEETPASEEEGTKEA